MERYGWTSSNNSYEREFNFLLEGAITDGYKEGDELLGKLNVNPQVSIFIYGFSYFYFNFLFFVSIY